MNDLHKAGPPSDRTPSASLSARGAQGRGPAPAYPYGQQAFPPYQGGFPVRCPRCSHIVSTRFCSFCGTDLSACYTVRPPAGQPAAPYVPPPPVPGGYYAPRPAAEKHTLRTVLIAAGIALVCVAFLFALLLAVQRSSRSKAPDVPDFGYTPPAGTQDYYYPQGISLTEYQQIKTGMSYARVRAIIGGDGQLVQSSQTIQEETYYTYMWYGEDSPYAAAYITFTGGAVSAIENEGLTDE